MRLPLLFVRRSFVRKRRRVRTTVTLDLSTAAENHIMRISQNNSDISGLVWCVAARRDQIADALWIASTFDIIGSDRARRSRRPRLALRTFSTSCVRAADQKQNLPSGPAFAK